MAYVNKEKKAKIAAELAKVLKPMGVKYTLAVRHHSTIVCTIRKAPIDFIENFNETQKKSWGESAYNLGDRKYVEVNPYHYEKEFSGKALEIVTKAINALNIDNFDRSDSQSDYFCVGHYVDLRIGKYDKPFEVAA